MYLLALSIGHANAQYRGMFMLSGQFTGDFSRGRNNPELRYDEITPSTAILLP